MSVKSFLIEYNLFDLLPEILDCVFSDYLTLLDIVSLDTACCSQRYRPILLSLFQRRSVVIHFDLHYRFGIYTDCQYWIALRGIHVDKLVLEDSNKVYFGHDNWILKFTFMPFLSLWAIKTIVLYNPTELFASIINRCCHLEQLVFEFSDESGEARDANETIATQLADRIEVGALQTIKSLVFYNPFPVFFTVVANCPGLEELVLEFRDATGLYYSDGIESHLLSAISLQSSVKSITLINCEIEDIPPLTFDRFPQLHMLAVDSNNWLSTAFIERITEAFGQLTYIRLGAFGYRFQQDRFCKHALMSLISKNRKTLEYISLNDADGDIVSVIASLPVLLALRLKFWDRKDSDTGMKALVGPLSVLSNSVRQLTLRGYVDDDGFGAAINSCQLSDLTLNKAWVADVAFIQFSHRLSSLTSLALGDTPVTDKALLAIAEHCNQIVHIRLVELVRVSDVGILALISANQGLSSVEFNNCRISDATVLALAYQCKHIRRAKLIGCVLIQWPSSIEELCRHSKLRSINDLVVCNCGFMLPGGHNVEVALATSIRDILKLKAN